MEFKGTKGKWEYLYDGCDHCYVIVSANSSICSTVLLDRIYFDTYKEIEANALLISKAPEMLEKLAEVKDLLEAYPSEAEMHLKAVEIRQLIKEATEL